MELDWQSPPIPIIHRSREWQSSQDSAGSSGAASTSAFITRRRSTVLHAPPPGPPPALPIPSVPALSPPAQYATYERASDMHDYQTGTSSQTHPYTRPAASASLAAVAAFSQARLAASSSPPPSAPSSPDHLSDSPPRSMLRARQAASPTEAASDRLLQPEPHRSETRPSSRRALTRALELAREAVRLDSTNDDPYGAVIAYGQSVALLSEVMERVMRGEDSTESHRKQNGRRRSVVAQEEEVRRLKSIHSPPSTYASSVISQSTTSTRPSTPSSTSPSTESSSDSLHVLPTSIRRRSRENLRHSSETARGDDEDAELDAAEAMGAALSTSTILPSAGRQPSATPITTVHPYASTSATPGVAVSLPNRTSAAPAVRLGRPRASSTLPPPAPPPTTLPPPAPSPTVSDIPVPVQSNTLRIPIPDTARGRGSSVSHSRTNSASRLASLQEEKSEDLLSPTNEIVPGPRYGDDGGRSKPRSQPNFDSVRPSPPLPPLPSSADSAITPRVSSSLSRTASEPATQSAGQYASQRPRGGSTFSTRSEMGPPASRSPLINTSPVNGTISQRRVKMSAPASSTMASSPTESNTSDASIPSMSRLNASTLPASTVSSLGINSRSRASSQPGRRPSIGASNSYFPPGATAMPNSAPVPRKASVPSRLNPNAPPHISINTALMSPPLGTASMAPLVPPPPIPHGNIPAAPLSPLPALAPPDPLRKPYHMMTLLRLTMTSKTGGYITRRLHVPQEVWSQGGVKLSNVPEKIRVVEVLLTALEEVQHWSAEYFGAGNVSSGMALGIGSIGRREGEAWAAKLEEFVGVCDSVVGNFGKKLSVGEGFVTKKSSGVATWGGRLTRQFDKITNGKNLDSPATYVQGLSRLFQQAQILDEHTKAAMSTPPAPLYAAFPADVRQAIEFKLRHASEFFARVVLTFVIQDMALLLDKYVKKCEKWLAE
ncbi:hypothetical protein IEO21_00324 [Rhodonia placenta]|uniref:MIT domain-containing protein n=1 Tax=Rhodonia placenta TaxID=104341 RepID=A0A8H7U8A4_9APHY|nr:hypothetical protein IEO21_00324 [Postia placenta]